MCLALYRFVDQQLRVHRLHRVASGRARGFTLIELLVVVVIIAVLAALGLPSLAEEMKDRQTQRTAQDIANLYRNARLRALARGSAVLVSYETTSGTRAHAFTVREAIRGGATNCARLPASSCQLANWQAAAVPPALGGNQVVDSLTLDATTQTSGLKVQFDGPGTGTAQASVAICYSPAGRAFVSVSGDTTALTTMTGVPLVRVYRTLPNGTDPIGLERRVVLLPNGQARLEAAGAKTSP